MGAHNEENMKIIKESKYEPHKIRTQPFKWINFPIFVGVWFILFWFVICPIVWSKVYSNQGKHWSVYWPFYFWGIAFLIFCVIMAILVLIWRLLSLHNRDKYNTVQLNPQYGDEKEEFCTQCSSFHPPGKNRCPLKPLQNEICKKCGNVKQSFGQCCQSNANNLENKIMESPPYDVTLKKQQHEHDIPVKRRPKHPEKSNSLKSKRSSTSSVVISMHNIGTKDLINKNITMNTKNVESSDEKSFKKKKPPNLKPVDVELANRESNVEFFGEKIPLKLKKVTNEPETSNKDNRDDLKHSDVENVPSDTPRNSAEMESMKKENFNRYLHLVEINTPFSPPKNDETDDGKPLKSPMSPREIFFYDLIHAAEVSESGNSPDSVNLGNNRYEKKRPVSHILLSSDVNLETDTDKMNEFKRQTLGNISTEKHVTKVVEPKKEAVDDMSQTKDEPSTSQEKKFTVKILRTVKKTIIDGKETENTVIEEKKILIPNIDEKHLSQQISSQDLHNLRKESVGQYFISDIKRAPPKPMRMNSQISNTSDKTYSNSDDMSPTKDDVFSDNFEH